MKKIVLANKISLNILFFLFSAVIVGSEIALDNAGAITAFLGQQTQITIQDPNQSDVIIRNFSDFSSIAELKENAIDVTTRVTEEGAVLLKNENNALPLTKGAKIGGKNV